MMTRVTQCQSRGEGSLGCWGDGLLTGLWYPVGLAKRLLLTSVLPVSVSVSGTGDLSSSISISGGFGSVDTATLWMSASISRY